MYNQVNSQAEKIIEEISAKREKMIDCANKNGLTNEETIRFSQELDELMNEYNRIFYHSPKANEENRFTLKKLIMIWPKELVEV